MPPDWGRRVTELVLAVCPSRDYVSAEISETIEYFASVEKEAAQVGQIPPLRKLAITTRELFWKFIISNRASKQISDFQFDARPGAPSYHRRLNLGPVKSMLDALGRFRHLDDLSIHGLELLSDLESQVTKDRNQDRKLAVPGKSYPYPETSQAKKNRHQQLQTERYRLRYYFPGTPRSLSKHKWLRTVKRATSKRKALKLSE
jgi:hypothetical protein